MRQAFSLIELIFVIVIVGILGAVAIPKFKYLKQNAEVSNIIATISDMNGSGGLGSYLNSTELNDINATELNITNLYKFRGNKWHIGDSNKDVNYTSRDGYMRAEFKYGNGEINVTLTCTDPDDVYKNIFNRKGYGCSSSGTVNEINLRTQE